MTEPATFRIPPGGTFAPLNSTDPLAYELGVGPYRTEYSCPGCAWVLRVSEPGIHPLPAVPWQGSIEATLDASVLAVARRHAEAIEDALAGHIRVG